MIMIILNTIWSLTRIYVICMSLEHLHDYNFYIEDLPMTYLYIRDAYFVDAFTMARSINTYYDFHNLFTDYSLSILISYNKEDFIGEDIIFNTTFLWYQTNIYMMALYILVNILYIYCMFYYYKESTGFSYIFLLNMVVGMYLFYYIYWNFLSYGIAYRFLLKFAFFLKNINTYPDLNYSNMNIDIFDNIEFSLVEPSMCSNANYLDYTTFSLIDFYKNLISLGYCDDKYIFFYFFNFLFFFFIVFSRYWVYEEPEYKYHLDNVPYDKKRKWSTRFWVTYEIFFLFEFVMYNYYTPVFSDFFIMYIFTLLLKLFMYFYLELFLNQFFDLLLLMFYYYFIKTYAVRFGLLAWYTAYGILLFMYYAPKWYKAICEMMPSFAL